MTRPLLSVVVPAYKAAGTIGDTLRSIHAPLAADASFAVEVVVVDDGSPDAEDLHAVVAAFPGVRLVSHSGNRGMCAARNSGIGASTGELVTILDADDRFVDGWPKVFARLAESWPATAGVCWSECESASGKPTVSEPGYSGPHSLDDLLNERRTGEYLPIFRGDYIRSRGYVDLGMRKSCGIVTYLTLATDGPFWISSRVLRIYNDARAGSVTSNSTDAEKARETAKCYATLLERYGDLYRSRAPRMHRLKLLRQAAYLRMAGEPNAWSTWWRGASPRCPLQSVGALATLLLGRRFCQGAVTISKRLGMIKRYG